MKSVKYKLRDTDRDNGEKNKLFDWISFKRTGNNFSKLIFKISQYVFIQDYFSSNLALEKANPIPQWSSSSS